MIKSKDTTNLKSNTTTSKKSISSRPQVDSIKKKIIKETALINKDAIADKISPVVTNDKAVDDNKRLFLKVAGVAGLGLAASALLPKQADAYVAGSTPTSNVVGIKNIANSKINPATEETLDTLAKEETLSAIKSKSDKLTFDGSNHLLTKVTNTSNNQINPATEESLANIGNNINDQSIWMLRKILTLLKPLGMVTGGGSNRLSVDVNSGAITASLASGQTLGTVTSVTTVATLTNLTNIGNVNSFSLMKDTARNAYSTSIRNNLSF